MVVVTMMSIMMTEQFGFICHLNVPIFMIGTKTEFRILTIINWSEHFIILTFFLDVMVMLVGFESVWLLSVGLKFLITSIFKVGFMIILDFFLWGMV